MVIFRGCIGRHDAKAQIPVPATTSISQKPADTGPWGELEVTPITIEAPADAALRFAQTDTSTWTFANCTSEKLSGLLKSAGLTNTQQQSLLRSARARIYTYPQPVGSSANGTLDCHWTSLNFWNPVPDDRFSNPGYVRDQLGTAAPWVLMRLPNLLGNYENVDVVKTLVFRKNDL